MIVKENPVQKIEEQIIDFCHQNNYPEGHRILSKNELAKLFKTKPSRIYTAIQNLVKKGYFFTKPGGGTFINSAVLRQQNIAPQNDFASRFLFPLISPSYQRIKVNISLDTNAYPAQTSMWQKVFDLFRTNYPFIELKISFDPESEDTYRYNDIFFATPATLSPYKNKKKILPINSLNDFEEQVLSPEIIRLGMIDNQLFGLPILRTPSMVFIDKNIFDRYGINVNSIKKPVDLFRTGREISRKSAGIIHGLPNNGFIYNSTMYGIVFKRNGIKVLIDVEKIRKFLKELQPFFTKEHFNHFPSSPKTSFYDNKYAIAQSFGVFYEEAREIIHSFIPIKFPLEKDGFGMGGVLIGCISSETRYRKDAEQLLKFLISEKAQEIFVQNSLTWLSVRRDVLDWQKQNSSFAEGTILYDFDIRAFSHQLDPVLYEIYPKKANTEVAKYFLGFQDIEETVRNLQTIY